MRVIAGEARGRRLRAPKAESVRPTSDRVREAIFDILASRGAVEDATVLDLFAGSGALGIEALSRGAASVVFVDHDREAIETIRANLATTGLDVRGPTASRVEVVQAEALAFCARQRRRFDLALCDPPYAFADWEALLGVLPARLAVLESSRPVPADGGFEVTRTYRYGTTLVSVVASPSGAAPEDAP